MNHIQKKTPTKDELFLYDLKVTRFIWDFNFATIILVIGSFLGLI